MFLQLTDIRWYNLTVYVYFKYFSEDYHDVFFILKIDPHILTSAHLKDLNVETSSMNIQF